MATKEQTRNNRLRGWKLIVALAAVMLAGAAGMRAASNQVIYDDALQNGWQF